MHHPALGQIIIAAPAAAFLTLDFDPSINPSYPNEHFFVSSVKFLYENKMNARMLLFLARLPNIILGAMLGLYVFIWGRRLWGLAGAYLALVFYSLSPDVLAHASLATTDLPIAAFLFIAAFYLYGISERGFSYGGVVSAGIASACAFTSKHTAILLIPFICFIFISRLRKDGWQRTTAAFAGYVAIIYAAIWAVYGFKYSATTVGLPWGAFGPSVFKPVFSVIRAVRFLPEGHLYSLAGTLMSGSSGGAGFLMGDYSSTGWWYYFIVAFFTKTPVATILFIIAASLYAMRQAEARQKALAMILPAATIFAAVSMQKVNIGIRHILPIYPFLFTLIGFVPSIKTASMRIGRVVSAAACLWYLWTAVAIFPHDLAYFNEFAGGPLNGYRFLVDSNLDWGQDLRGLKTYMDEHGIKRIKLAYFGLSDPAYYGIDYEYMPSYVILNPKGVKEDIELKGWFAISATMLQGVYLPQRDFYKIFKDATPVARIGYSIFVYDLGQPVKTASASPP